MLEIEVKIRIEKTDSLRNQLIKLKAVITKERHHEVNTLYDYPSNDLFKNKQAVRLRSVNKKKHFLTFKGTPQKSRQFKVRDEFETEVRNLRHTRKILEALGLNPSYHYEKFRTVYRFKRLNICLNRTPGAALLPWPWAMRTLSKAI